MGKGREGSGFIFKIEDLPRVRGRNFVDYKSRKLMNIRKFRRRSRKKWVVGEHPRGVQTWKQVQELAPLGAWPLPEPFPNQSQW